MKYLVKHGQSTLALDQYQRCRRTLLREFGVEPLPDTQRLYQKILDQRKNIPASDKQYRGYSTPVHAKSATR
jgi:DNA-binding SARP family transcriptional activator